MTQRCWKAFARTFGVLAALALVVGLPALQAQATGKLEGHVTDAQSQPIPNATVLIPGTAFTAPTNAQGYYFIENIPAGTYSARAQYVGYRPLEIQGLRITSGQTITEDFKLEQAPVTVQQIVVTEQAVNALVPRDQVTSKDIVTGSMVSKLPVDRVEAALSMQAGVVQVTNCGTNGACTPSFSVRGSRTSEQATYVDGVPIQSAITSGNMVRQPPQLGLAVNAFEDASITTGAASSEFSSAQGGIINLTTRTGGSKLSGSLGYETAALGGQKYGQGYNRLAGSLGGPIMHNLTFFVAAGLEGTTSNSGGYQGYLYPSYTAVRVDTTFRLPVTAGSATSDSTDVNVYDYAATTGECSTFPFIGGAASANQSQRAQDMRNNYGVSCNANQAYAAPSTYYNATAKLNYSFGQGSRFAASYIFSGSQNRGVLADGAASGSQSGSNVAILNWTQTIFRKATHQLSVDAYLSWQWNNSMNSNLTVASEQATRSSPMGFITHKLQFNMNPKDAPVDSTLIYNFLLQKTSNRIGITDAKNTNQYNGQGSFMPNASCPIDANASGHNPGSSTPNPGPQCAAGGNGAFGNEYGLSYDVENRLVGKVDFDWQVDRYNRMTIGGLFTNWQQLTNYTGSTVGGNDFTGKPVNRSAYAEDRLDLGDVVLVGGVRYDYFWSKAYRWNEFPDISTRPGFTPDSLFCPAGATPSATASCALIQDPAHHYVSPHVQVAFPVTPTTNFRLSYAQAVQQPDMGLIYENALTDINTGGANSRSRWGSDLDFGKTIKFEFGARHAFSPDMVLDVAVYNNDNVANPSIKFTYPIDPQTGAPTRIYVAQNTDFGNARGIEITLDRRIGTYFNGRIDYTYESAVNTGTDPTSYINYFEPLIPPGTIAEPPTAALTTGTSRPQNLAAQFTLALPPDFMQGSIVGKILHRTSLFVQARLASGLPYTACLPTDATTIQTLSTGACGEIQAVTSINAARLPMYKQFDARLTRDFRIGRYQFTGYVDGRNIFNMQNIVQVWATTGTTTNGPAYAVEWTTDSIASITTAKLMGMYDATTGNINLPTSVAGCAKVSSGSVSYAAPCFYYIQSEMRFGNGDGTYTLAERKAASDERYAYTRSVSNFVTGARVIRFGLEVNF